MVGAGGGQDGGFRFFKEMGGWWGLEAGITVV